MTTTNNTATKLMTSTDWETMQFLAGQLDRALTRGDSEEADYWFSQMARVSARLAG